MMEIRHKCRVPPSESYVTSQPISPEIPLPALGGALSRSQDREKLVPGMGRPLGFRELQTRDASGAGFPVLQGQRSSVRFGDLPREG